MQTKFAPANMHGVIPAGVHGAAKIVHDTPDKFTRLHAALHGQPLSEGTYTRLIVNNELWMTDAEFEWRTNLEAVRRMTGDVLIAGLGIGFIIQPLLNKPDITSITVLENNPDVIALVGQHYPTIKIIEADARSWIPPKKSFDCVYLDIWPNIPNSDDRQDIKDLKKRYRPALRKGGWIKAWCEDYAR